jgi:acetylornithine deacetylase
MTNYSRDDELWRRLSPQLSKEACRDLFAELVRIPCPQREMLEGEPALREFIVRALVPRVRALGAKEVRLDRMGNLLSTFGRGASGRSLLLIGHAMNQPPNAMPDPYEANIVDGAPYGFSGQVIRGRGASEQKGTLTAMLCGMQAVFESGIEVAGTLHFACCVSGETGREDAIREVVESGGMRAEMAVVYGNENKLQLGNRGRIDLRVVVHGKSCHSSRPADGCNAVTGAVDVIRRLGAQFDPSRAHPGLGAATLTINGIRSGPDSTHTVQDRCTVSLDRRLLPDEDPDAAADEIERIVMGANGTRDPVSGQPYAVELQRGACTRPSLVDRDAPVAHAKRKAGLVVLGQEPPVMYGQSAFDQGYLNYVGIPTVNFGPGEQRFAHTVDDLASIDRTFDAAKVFAFLIADHLGRQTAS